MGSAPGGASVMIAMSEAFGADPRLVGFMQYLRVGVVVLTASFVSRLLRIPQCAGRDRKHRARRHYVAIGWYIGLGLLHTDALTAYLATSPGGLDSMAIIAVGGGANVPFVLAIQTLRFVIVLITGPLIARLIAQATSPSTALTA